MNEHVTIQVTGRVQGVWFRKSAQGEAKRLSLVGYAKNNPDGTVTIEAWGERKDLEELVVWCEEGSRLARVDVVEKIFDDKHNDTYHDFKIL